MELKEFNNENTSVRSGTPSISINTKSGVFNFNKASCELAGLTAGDRIVLYQDTTEKQNWYFEKISADDTRGFQLRGKDEKTGSPSITRTWPVISVIV